MFLAILTLITALTISAVAIYYSVAGLVAIFAAAAVPIIIMGGALEIGKLVTAVWLHKHWERATWWLKTYLSVSVAVLMFITSMGIFGFLSKAHIEQTSAAGEGVAQIEQIEKEIARQEAIVLRAEQTIEKTQTSGTGADQNIQAQIDREQARIDSAYDRVQPAIDATNKKLENDKEFYLDQLPTIEEKLVRFNEVSNIDTTDEEAVKRLQSLVGTRPDGAYGGGTARAVSAYKAGLEQERTDILAKIEELKADAQEEIQRLRSRAEAEIDDSNKLIGRLRGQLGQSTSEDIDTIIDEQTQRISRANTELDKLTEEKFTLEAEYRKLEAEVGPIKYIAEFIYGDQADKDLLEEAVRWVIIVIIFVFDPLAVLLLIASQYTFNWSREERNETATKEEDEPNDDDARPEYSDGDGPLDGTDQGSEESVPEEQTTDPEQVQKALDDWDTATQKETKGLVEDFPTVWYEENERIDIIGQNGNDGLHYDEVENFSEEDPISKDEKINQEVEIIETETETVEAEIDSDYDSEEDYEETDDDILESVHELERQAMRDWKADNPTDSLKRQRRLLELGKINVLPWETEDYLITKEEDADVAEAIKWAQEQAEKKTYQQNSEQSEESLWGKIKRDE